MVVSIFDIVCFSFCNYSRFLGNIKEAFDKNPNLVNLLLDDFFLKAIHDCQVRIPLISIFCVFDMFTDR